jgi:hypothetical protein
MKQTPDQLSATRDRIASSYCPDKHADTDTGAVWYTGSKGKLFYAMGFSGAKSKPDFFFRFNGELFMNNQVTSWLAGIKKNEAEKQERAAKKVNFKTTLKVGDILLGTWGYEQTNATWLQVTAILGDKRIKVRQIKKTYQATGDMNGYEMPIKDSFTDKPEMTKTVSLGYLDREQIKHEHSEPTLWDGQRQSVSSYN